MGVLTGNTILDVIILIIIGIVVIMVIGWLLGYHPWYVGPRFVEILPQLLHHPTEIFHNQFV